MTLAYDHNALMINMLIKIHEKMETLVRSAVPSNPPLVGEPIDTYMTRLKHGIHHMVLTNRAQALHVDYRHKANSSGFMLWDKEHEEALQEILKEETSK